MMPRRARIAYMDMVRTGPSAEFWLPPSLWVGVPQYHIHRRLSVHAVTDQEGAVGATLWHHCARRSNLCSVKCASSSRLHNQPNARLATGDGCLCVNGRQRGGPEGSIAGDPCQHVAAGHAGCGGRRTAKRKVRCVGPRVWGSYTCRPALVRRPPYLQLASMTFRARTRLRRSAPTVPWTHQTRFSPSL